jgi:hypothetical protein
LVEDIRLVDETNGYLKRKIEAKDLEFECMIRVKEQEVHGAVMKLNGVLVERDLKANMLMQIEEKYKILEENKRQVRGHTVTKSLFPVVVDNDTVPPKLSKFSGLD